MSTLTLKTVTDQAQQGRTIAALALQLPERPTTADVLNVLNRAYTAGCDDTTEKLARDILRGQNVLKRQAL
jgi:hypothetical protein